ncbi:MAG: hypothetical protein V9G04_08850 [Nocardioides sp.]|jgi:voltage-gated potassium channel
MTRVERWERRAETPLLLLAVAFLVAYAWPVLDPRLSRDWRNVLTVLSWSVWAAFALDFAVRLYLAEGDRRRYAVAHWYDVALIALPMLRPLRLLRLLAFARVLNRSAAGSLVGQVTPTWWVSRSLPSAWVRLRFSMLSRSHRTPTSPRLVTRFGGRPPP